MNMLELIQRNPNARLRSKKNLATAYLLKERYKFLKDIDLQMIADMVAEAHSQDRTWRKIMETEPLLRGYDYKEKHALESKKRKQLGYPY